MWLFIKNLAESGHLFNHSGGVIPRTLNVLSREYYPSDLNFKTILFYVTNSCVLYIKKVFYPHHCIFGNVSFSKIFKEK